MNIFLLTFVAGVVGLQDICLPSTHEAHVHTRVNAWSDERMSHHHDEYNEGDHMHVWFDSVSRKSMVHIYEKDWYNHQGETHHFFGLRDYTRQLYWHGYWNHTTQTVSNCQLEVYKKPFEIYCVARQANLTGSGTVGQHANVDFWSATFEDRDRKFKEDIHMILEKGSNSVVMQERVFGEHYNETEQKLWKWIEHREWFDMNENAIPASSFAIPVGCPQ